MPFKATFVFIIDNICIYDVRNGEFKVGLVKENVLKVIADTAKSRHYTSFTSVVNTIEAVANSVFFFWNQDRFKNINLLI